MNERDLARIESELGVTLPAAYREASLCFPFTEDEGTMHWSMGDVAIEIVRWTKEYRAGYAVNPPWPAPLVCIGTEGDGCPLALDTDTGRVMKLDKGNPRKSPLEDYANFEAFMCELVRAWAELSDDERTRRS